MIQTKLFEILSTNENVTAIVGTKIFPMRVPQGESVPCVVYDVRLDNIVNSLDGDSGLEAYRVEVKCWAKDYLTAHGLGLEVRKAILESGEFSCVTEAQDDEEDVETLNYCASYVFSIWSLLAIESQQSPFKKIQASEVITDTSGFDNNLSELDDTVQKALQTLNDLEFSSNLSDLNDVIDTDKAEGRILKVDADGNHIYVDDDAIAYAIAL